MSGNAQHVTRALRLAASVARQHNTSQRPAHQQLRNKSRKQAQDEGWLQAQEQGREQACQQGKLQGQQWSRGQGREQDGSRSSALQSLSRWLASGSFQHEHADQQRATLVRIRMQLVHESSQGLQGSAAEVAAAVDSLAAVRKHLVAANQPKLRWKYRNLLAQLAATAMQGYRRSAAAATTAPTKQQAQLNAHQVPQAGWPHFLEGDQQHAAGAGDGAEALVLPGCEEQALYMLAAARAAAKADLAKGSDELLPQMLLAIPSVAHQSRSLEHVAELLTWHIRLSMWSSEARRMPVRQQQEAGLKLRPTPAGAAGTVSQAVMKQLCEHTHDLLSARLEAQAAAAETADQQRGLGILRLMPSGPWSSKSNQGSAASDAVASSATGKASGTSEQQQQQQQQSMPWLYHLLWAHANAGSSKHTRPLLSTVASHAEWLVPCLDDKTLGRLAKPLAAAAQPQPGLVTALAEEVVMRVLAGRLGVADVRDWATCLADLLEANPRLSQLPVSLFLHGQRSAAVQGVAASEGSLQPPLFSASLPGSWLHAAAKWIDNTASRWLSLGAAASTAGTASPAGSALAPQVDPIIAGLAALVQDSNMTQAPVPLQTLMQQLLLVTARQSYPSVSMKGLPAVSQDGSAQDSSNSAGGQQAAATVGGGRVILEGNRSVGEAEQAGDYFEPFSAAKGDKEGSSLGGLSVEAQQQQQQQLWDQCSRIVQHPTVSSLEAIEVLGVASRMQSQGLTDAHAITAIAAAVSSAVPRLRPSELPRAAHIMSNFLCPDTGQGPLLPHELGLLPAFQEAGLSSGRGTAAGSCQNQAQSDLEQAQDAVAALLQRLCAAALPELGTLSPVQVLRLWVASACRHAYCAAAADKRSRMVGGSLVAGAARGGNVATTAAPGETAEQLTAAAIPLLIRGFSRQPSWPGSRNPADLLSKSTELHPRHAAQALLAYGRLGVAAPALLETLVAHLQQGLTASMALRNAYSKQPSGAALPPQPDHELWSEGQLSALAGLAALRQPPPQALLGLLALQVYMQLSAWRSASPASSVIGTAEPRSTGSNSYTAGSVPQPSDLQHMACAVQLLHKLGHLGPEPYTTAHAMLHTDLLTSMRVLGAPAVLQLMSVLQPHAEEGDAPQGHPACHLTTMTQAILPSAAAAEDGAAADQKHQVQEQELEPDAEVNGNGFLDSLPNQTAQSGSINTGNVGLTLPAWRIALLCQVLGLAIPHAATLPGRGAGLADAVVASLVDSLDAWPREQPEAASDAEHSRLEKYSLALAAAASVAAGMAATSGTARVASTDPSQSQPAEFVAAGQGLSRVLHLLAQLLAAGSTHAACSYQPQAGTHTAAPVTAAGGLTVGVSAALAVPPALDTVDVGLLRHQVCLALQLGFQQRMPALSLQRIAAGTAAFSSAEPPAHQAAALAAAAGQALKQRMHELYAASVDEVRGRLKPSARLKSWSMGKAATHAKLTIIHGRAHCMTACALCSTIQSAVVGQGPAQPPLRVFVADHALPQVAWTLLTVYSLPSLAPDAGVMSVLASAVAWRLGTASTSLLLALASLAAKNSRGDAAFNEVLMAELFTRLRMRRLTPAEMFETCKVRQ